MPVDRFPAQGAASSWRVWGPVLIGILILYVPTYLRLYQTSWSNEGGTQGPLLLLIAIWLVWKNRHVFAEVESPISSSLGGWALVAAGAAMYAVGRSQQFIQLEAFSQIPLFSGIALVLLGRRLAYKLLFPVAFFAALVPVPGSMLDAILLPLKTLVSEIVASSLFLIGLPIARDGVMIYAGPYELLVANACSGLNSMIALTVIGILYVYLTSHKTRAHCSILLAAVLPIAFLANVFRVTSIVLATLEGGDATGRYFHAYAAYGEIVFAFGLFMLLDRLLDKSERPSKGRANDSGQ